MLLLLSCAFCSASSFPLFEKNKGVYVSLSENEEFVVQTAKDMFFSDVEDVFGQMPVLSRKAGDAIVVAATIGKNSYVDQLISSKKIDVSSLTGQWEAFRIQVYNNNGKKQLLIIGSDSRGTAYGILEISRLVGVSPWEWWADATPYKKDSFDIPDDFFSFQKPSVQYRGIFLNDEDWGLMPWSSNNYEKSTKKGQIGPKTYARIFELLLRLRANTLWPAMHESTIPFYFVEGNKEMADKYGIVLGTSHCEPLMRNSAGEWDKAKYGEYNYLTNKDNILNYWEERLKETSLSGNIFTIGMRGVHDGKMEGVKTLDEQTSVLSRVISDQRALLAKHLNRDADKIPQSFIPYKEVLSIYDNGLDLPDDVTLVWCDDNYGYITRLSDEKEQKRKGGAGVYYHISYWGRPHDYLWLSTTSAAQIYWQMKKAWDANVRKLWIVNVGDIKPAEYSIEFFLDMAWNIDSVNPESIYDHQDRWLVREFGEELAKEISPLMQEYYRLANIRKPEFMGWSRVEEYSAIKGGRTPVIDSEFNPHIFGDQTFTRLAEYEAISHSATEIEKRIPQGKKAAYFQLVQYPVCASAEMNKKLLYAQKARLYASYNLPVANEYAVKSRNAFNEIFRLTNIYNKELQDGKWDGMMSMKPRDLNVFKEADLPDDIACQQDNDIVVWTENQDRPHEGKIIDLIPFIYPSGNKTFISVFQRGKNPILWKVSGKPQWLIVVEEKLDLLAEKRINFSVDWDKVGVEQASAQCTLDINGEKYTINIQANKKNIAIPVEYNKMVVLQAMEYVSRENDKVIPVEGLGYSAKAIELAKGNSLKYKVYTTSVGDAVIRICLIPNHPLNGNDIRYAVSVDGEEPRIVSYKTEFRDQTWKINVLRNQSVNITRHKFNTTGEHTIEIRALDEGVVLDQLMLDFNPDRKFYGIPVKK